jgi:hypothetical protein
MTVLARFDERAWAIPEARYAVRVVCSLLDGPVRFVAPGAEADANAPTVFVGDPARAPDHAAAIVTLRDWSPTEPSRWCIESFDGVPLLTSGSGTEVGSERELPAAWLRSIAALLLREEEAAETHRDEWGCFSGFSSRLHELELLDRPLVNRYAQQLWDRIERWAERRGTRVERIPRWQGDARFAVLLGHDVDWVRRYSVQESIRLLGQARGVGSYAFRHGLRLLADSLVRHRTPDPYSAFDRWMEAEIRHGFRSTFYFFADELSQRHAYDATYRYSDKLRLANGSTTVGALMRRMVDEGFEVGLHGSYESYANGDELARQRSAVERGLGSPVFGVRQHFLRFDAASTWAAQEAAGFRYDTTLGYNEAVGFRAGIAAPFHPFDPTKKGPRTLLELPLTAMDGALFRTLKLDARLALRRVREHLEAVEAVGGLAVILWHPNTTDTDAFPGWWECYLGVLKYLEGRSVWVPNAAELASWWLEREARLALEP